MSDPQNDFICKCCGEQDNGPHWRGCLCTECLEDRDAERADVRNDERREREGS